MTIIPPLMSHSPPWLLSKNKLRLSHLEPLNRMIAFSQDVSHEWLYDTYNAIIIPHNIWGSLSARLDSYQVKEDTMGNDTGRDLESSHQYASSSSGPITCSVTNFICASHCYIRDSIDWLINKPCI